MNALEACRVLGVMPNTLINTWTKTRINMADKGIYIKKEGRGVDTEYEIKIESEETGGIKVCGVEDDINYRAKRRNLKYFPWKHKEEFLNGEWEKI